ncbi:unnamed protein product [Polarella glacialis]|uniref:Uncharacterized protein n=1 Tax=Polarella glacialis TaxID=89957 RepID=A0A813GL67_POLGL|nr:unnamed protein product [Polarella glacialis]CAE8626951.1 unnamed protein product [Polarella glacialis]CAE8711306.1 unnamed protein product [Polarella glacialis]
MNVCTALMLLASLGHANADSIFRETFSAATCADDVKKYDKYYYTEKCTKVDDKSYTKAWCDDGPDYRWNSHTLKTRAARFTTSTGRLSTIPWLAPRMSTRPGSGTSSRAPRFPLVADLRVANSLPCQRWERALPLRGSWPSCWHSPSEALE